MSPLHDKIASLTDRSGGPIACWPWLGNVGGSGTASLFFQRKNYSVRRVMYEATHGPVPKNRLVGMTCENRQCMNVAHMTLLIINDPVPRFWKNVHRLPGADACWIWTATRAKISKTARGAGYGGFMVRFGFKVQAHRYSWELAYGPIPEGMLVCHRCDNPPCVRPDHLFLGTPADNMRDKMQKGRANHPAHRRLLVQGDPK